VSTRERSVHRREDTRRAARVDALATPRNCALLIAAGGIGLLAFFLLRPTYPNYDSYYSLLWGRQLAGGALPDYTAFRAPTPHPLHTLAAALLAPFGGAADRILVLVGLGAYLGLLVACFHFVRGLLGALVALAAVAAVLTRTDLVFLAARGTVDVPFLALVLLAGALETARPRRGLSVLVLLVLAGLLRPEAWALSAAYFVWLAAGERLPPGRLLRLATVTAAAPALWLLFDWVVTGDPLHSMVATRESATDHFRSVLDAARRAPIFLGADEREVTLAAGGLGSLLALHLLGRRAVLPLALAAAGVVTFLALAVAGLPTFPRYLALPSLLLTLAVGVALAGAAVTGGVAARRLALGLTALTLALLAWRAPDYVKDLRGLNDKSTFVGYQHRDLKAVLDDPEVAALLERCHPLTTPTHSTIPVVRVAAGLGEDEIQASTAQQRPPTHGLLLIGHLFNFEPIAARPPGAVDPRSARRPWSNSPLPGFAPIAREGRWAVYGRCDGRALARSSPGAFARR
jgi:hypothetical protein